MQRLLHRVEICRLGIVNVANAADFPDEFTAMGARLIGAKRSNHLLKRQPSRTPRSTRRHQVLDVMRPAHLRVGQAQNGLVLVNNRSVGEPEIGLIGVPAEGDFSGSNFWQMVWRVEWGELVLSV